MTHNLQGRTIVMSGGSRGIGLAILLAAARSGASAVLLAKTGQPHPRLPGTVHTAVKEITAAGGKAVAVVGDVRAEEDIERAVATAVRNFGGIDIVINNASVLNLTGTADLTTKQFDLIQQVNLGATFLLTRAALPHLRNSADPQVPTLSPPINLAPHWLGKFPSYMMSKYGMTLLTLGFAAELADLGIRANCLWPQTTIATSAVINLLGESEAGRSRTPDIMADAAITLLTDPTKPTGRALIDVDVLAAAGMTDLSGYGGTDHPELDFFIDPA
jgi:citronellol/citronellal dehydrogenase